MFVLEFVSREGIKEIMGFIEEAQAIKNYDLVSVSLQMLANILSYKAGIDFITKRAKKYVEKFLELAGINQNCKKQAIRIFFNMAKSNLPEVFDIIEKTAVKHAEETGTLPFHGLVQGFGFEDLSMAMTLIKFINEMLFKSEGDDKK